MRIADSGGKIINPDINMAPIMRIPTTIIRAVIRAVAKLNTFTFVPAACAND
jgi:hypothetical protein